MSDREIILKTVEEMPNTASFNEIVDELRLLASIRSAQEQVRNGEGVPHGEVAKRLNSWITESSGRPKR